MVCEYFFKVVDQSTFESRSPRDKSKFESVGRMECQVFEIHEFTEGKKAPPSPVNFQNFNGGPSSNKSVVMTL